MKYYNEKILPHLIERACSSKPATKQREKIIPYADGIVLETATFGESEQTELNRVFLANSGSGYTSLPNLSIITENGANANLIANTTDIGKVTEIKVTDEGFKYSTAPDVSLNTNLILVSTQKEPQFIVAEHFYSIIMSKRRN